jgi:colanic acid/amylovoran biosynthesis glycosyltransferase
MSGTGKAGTIAYVGRILPALSETFVTREIQALQEAGLDVASFSLFKPRPGELHPEQMPIATETCHIFRPLNPLFWLLHLWYMVTAPAAYFPLLWRYFLLPRRGLRKHFRLVGQFLMAPYAAWRMNRRGVGHIHAHFANSPTGIAMMAARLLGIGFSFTAHSFDIFIENAELEEKIRRAEFVVTVSRYNRDYLYEQYSDACAGTAIHVIRCGLDIDRFQPHTRPRNEPPAILSIGRLIDLKGFDLLIRAVALLKERGTKVFCRIVGEGPERHRLEQLRAELGLEKQVELSGALFQETVMKAYRAADLFVLPCVERGGDADNLPVVLIEALAFAIPTISTRLRAIPELIIDGETGLLVPPDDAEALVDAIQSLIDDPDRAAKLAETGRELVRKEFDVHKTAEMLINLFRAR